MPAIGQATIDAPELTPDGNGLKLEARSVKTVEQAWNICKMLEQNNRQRAARTADIQAMHDGAPPKSSDQNAGQGRSWQSNASTGWLAGVSGRVAQRFVNSAISQLYETSSSLPESIPDHKEKTDKLRALFTRLVRAWDGNVNLLNAIASENTLQGYAYAVFLDPYTWKPTMFKQDRAWVPERSGQHARDLQFFVAKMDYRLDEFLDLFKDEQVASDVGYDLKNCVEAANLAQMADPREDGLTTRFRSLVEMQNEGVLGLTYTSSGERVVKTYLLFNREYDGSVSFWLIARDNGKPLRFSFKLFKSMEDVMSMFSFAPGNGTLHSSKGIGRLLANLSQMKEVFRNSIVDAARISSLMVVQCDAKDKTKFAPAIMAPFIMLDKGVNIGQQQFQLRAESLQAVDTMIDSWAEQSVGAYLTQQIDPSGKTVKTATEASIDARRESEAADIMIRRWLDQWSSMRQVQQKRVFSDENIAEAVKAYELLQANPELDVPEFFEASTVTDSEVLRILVEALQAGIAPDEMRLWRKSLASPLAHVGEGAIQQGILMVKEAYSGNPNVDQGKMDAIAIESIVGPDVARKLIIPNVDQTVMAEASRLQMMESTVMTQSGLAIPVSERDNHLVHGMTIQQLLTDVAAPALSQPNPPDALLKATELNLNHLGEHLAAATRLGQNKNVQFGELDKFYAGFKSQLAQVIQINTDAQLAQVAIEQAVKTGMRPGGEVAQQPEAMPPESPLQTAQSIPTAEPVV